MQSQLTLLSRPTLRVFLSFFLSLFLSFFLAVSFTAFSSSSSSLSASLAHSFSLVFDLVCHFRLSRLCLLRFRFRLRLRRLRTARATHRSPFSLVLSRCVSTRSFVSSISLLYRGHPSRRLFSTFSFSFSFSCSYL